MADTHHAQGPGKSVLGIGQRIVSIMVEMVETRLRLAVVELEEEKAKSKRAVFREFFGPLVYSPQPRWNLINKAP